MAKLHKVIEKKCTPSLIYTKHTTLCQNISTIQSSMFYFGIQISNNIVETTVCLQHVLYNEHDENLEFDISKQGSRDDI
jgi:hypothetical protein